MGNTRGSLHAHAAHQVTLQRQVRIPPQLFLVPTLRAALPILSQDQRGSDAQSFPTINGTKAEALVVKGHRMHGTRPMQCDPILRKKIVRLRVGGGGVGLTNVELAV